MRGNNCLFTLFVTTVTYFRIFFFSEYFSFLGVINWRICCFWTMKNNLSIMILLFWLDCSHGFGVCSYNDHNTKRVVMPLLWIFEACFCYSCTLDENNYYLSTSKSFYIGWNVILVVDLIVALCLHLLCVYYCDQMYQQYCVYCMLYLSKIQGGPYVHIW